MKMVFVVTVPCLYSQSNGFTYSHHSTRVSVSERQSWTNESFGFCNLIGANFNNSKQTTFCLTMSLILFCDFVITHLRSENMSSRTVTQISQTLQNT